MYQAIYKGVNRKLKRNVRVRDTIRAELSESGNCIIEIPINKTTEELLECEANTTFVFDGNIDFSTGKVSGITEVCLIPF